MGLDMYLHVEKYISRNDYSHTDEGMTVSIRPEFQAITDLLGTANLISPEDWTGYAIQIPVGYWRKANAVHGWFVANCGNHEDNCQKMWVSPEKAQELVNLCKEVIANPVKASTLLPTGAGFFFGSTDYDEWYLNDIQRTIDIIEPLLANGDVRDSIYYQASW